MESVAPNSFLPLIQLAITPVILLSGVGALMITLTNRLGRVVDRTRALAGQLRLASQQAAGGQASGDRGHIEQQIDILWSRAKLVRRAVTYAGLSMLLSCLLVMVIFVDALRGGFGGELVLLFVASVLCVILAIIAFLRDIWKALWALNLEVTKVRGQP